MRARERAHCPPQVAHATRRRSPAKTRRSNVESHRTTRLCRLKKRDLEKVAVLSCSSMRSRKLKRLKEAPRDRFLDGRSPNRSAGHAPVPRRLLRETRGRLSGGGDAFFLLLPSSQRLQAQRPSRGMEEEEENAFLKWTLEGRRA